MHKYRLVRQRIERHPAIVAAAELRVSPFVAIDDLLLCHDSDYVDRYLSGRLSEKEVRKTGFPWSIAGVQRTLASTGGTVAAMRDVLTKRSGVSIAGQLAGGTHHAYRAHGEGFCIFNDIAVAAHVAMRDFGLERIVVFDMDVHQGNGTAKLFEHDDRVITFSAHGAKNYPLVKERSDYDVELEDGAGDDKILSVVRQWLPFLIQRHSPQLLFYQAGVDSLEVDSLGRLSVTRGGLQARNRLVFDMCLSASVPLVVNMGGGYARPIDPSVECHADVFVCAAERANFWRDGREH